MQNRLKTLCEQYVEAPRILEVFINAGRRTYNSIPIDIYNVIVNTKQPNGNKGGDSKVYQGKTRSRDTNQSGL